MSSEKLTTAEKHKYLRSLFILAWLIHRSQGMFTFTSSFCDTCIHTMYVSVPSRHRDVLPSWKLNLRQNHSKQFPKNNSREHRKKSHLLDLREVQSSLRFSLKRQKVLTFRVSRCVKTNMALLQVVLHETLHCTLISMYKTAYSISICFILLCDLRRDAW